MTDREKLEIAIDNYRTYLLVSRREVPEEFPLAKERLKYALEVFDMLFLPNLKYQPSSRPCFDKPAGTPILHWETL